MKLKSGAGMRICRVGLNHIDDLLFMEESCFPTDRTSRRNLRNLLRSASACCLGAFREGELVGNVKILFRSGTRSARIHSLAVAESARGTGLGRRLMTCIEQEAKHRGCTRLRLEVRMDNTPAIRLYEELGFKDIQVLPGYYEDGTHAMLYRKEF